jgi:hypothetical protein
MSRYLLATLVIICLVMPFSSTLAQEKTDLRILLPTEFNTQFKSGTVNVYGTIQNKIGQNFDCLDLTFQIGTQKGKRTETVSVIKLGPKESKDFGIRLPPGRGVEHTATSLCKTPVVVSNPVPGGAEPRPPASEPMPPAPKPQVDQTCTLVGQLKSDRGFNAQFKETPNGPTQTSVLDTAVLLINGKFAMDAPMDVQGNTAYYRFPDVPLGMTFELALGGGWYFLSGKLPVARCNSAGVNRHISTEAVGFR